MTQTLAQALQAFTPGLPLVVAFSGGADSTALLAACLQRWPGHVRAVHVHHGLQSAADDFQKHCEAFCTKRQVPLVVQAIDARAASGQSPEEAARKGRYAALMQAVQTHWPEARDIALARSNIICLQTVPKWQKKIMQVLYRPSISEMTLGEVQRK